MDQLLPDSKDPNPLTLGDSESSTNSQVMVNFDSGELFIGAKENWAVEKQGAIGARSKLYNSNIALGIAPALNGVVGLNAEIFPAVNTNWDEVTVNSIVEHFYNAQIMSIDRYPAAYNTPLSSIWLFRTSDGSMGILQILGFTDNPRGVKIRYKLVLKANPKQGLNSTQINRPSASTPPAGPVELKLKWPSPGQRMVFDTDMERDGSYFNPGQPVLDETASRTNKYGLTVVQTTPDGGHEMELEFLGI
jgi:hypothetical protein